jgi:hypothetical protein
VFRFSVLVFDKIGAPFRHPAFSVLPQAIYPILMGSRPGPAPAQPAATPRVTLTRATLPAAPPQALRVEQGMPKRPWLYRSGDPATNPTLAYGNSLPSLVPSAQRLRRERLRRVSVSSPILGSNAECSFPLHLSDSALCFSALPACQAD